MFRTVALPVIEAETNLLTVEARLNKRVAAYLPTLLAVPDSNPAAGCVAALPQYHTTHESPLQQTRLLLKKTLSNKPYLVSKQHPWLASPWSTILVLHSGKDHDSI